MVQQYSGSDGSHYCRLLPSANSPADVQAHLLALSELGRAMVDDRSELSQAPEALLHTGYTYFGQFVDHDLSRDDTSLAGAWTTAAEEIANGQTPFLDLDHLYGRGPFEQPSLYEEGDVRLKVSRITGRAGTPFDVGGDGADVPVVADDRTIENVILRQVASVFARLHNAAVEQHRPAGHHPEQLFARARHQTTWQYQRLVRDDYLLWVLDRRVYDAVFRQNRVMVEWRVFSIPVEFSVAAMRIGHSMARERYLIARGVDKTLRELFHPARQTKLLPPDWEIDWGFFFQGATQGSSALASRPIDTRIVRSLHNLPDFPKRLLNSPCFMLGEVAMPSLAINNLPARTLIRGAGLNLPTGQAAAEAFHESVFTEEELTTDRNGKLTPAGRVIRDARLGADTPLWYYLLKESELRYNGNRLGPVGSRIIAETFHAALHLDPHSIVNHPEAPSGAIEWVIGGREMQFSNLRALFAAAPALR
jgi:hypothetical protein